MPENYILNRKTIHLKKAVPEPIVFTAPEIITNLADYSFQVEFPTSILLSTITIDFEFVTDAGYRTVYQVTNMDMITGIFFDFRKRMKAADSSIPFTKLTLTSTIDTTITLTIKRMEGGFEITGLV